MNKCKWSLLLILTLAAAGCRRDMQNQPKYNPLSRSWFYPDGRSARPIPAGTIAIDEVNLDPAKDTGMLNGQFVDTIPVPVTADLLVKGQVQYNVYCAPCHGRTGSGYGIIATRGFRAPADLTGTRVRNAPPGYIYQVIVKGYGAMAPYDYMVKKSEDRWAIIAYVRALELSRRAAIDDVPAQERATLESKQ